MFHEQKSERLMPRSAYRLKFTSDAHLLREGRPDEPIEVQDLSTIGFMARCESPVAIGSEVFLLLPKGEPIAADVLWNIGGRVGCKFQRELSREKVLLFFLRTSQTDQDAV